MMEGLHNHMAHVSLGLLNTTEHLLGHQSCTHLSSSKCILTTTKTHTHYLLQ